MGCCFAAPRRRKTNIDCEGANGLFSVVVCGGFGGSSFGSVLDNAEINADSECKRSVLYKRVTVKKVVHVIKIR